MRIVSFNVNGIRSRLHQLQAVNETLNPDVVAVQESKVVDEAFPHEDVEACGFPHQYVYGQKTHYGVALLSKQPLKDVRYGFQWEGDEQQRRFIAATARQGRKDFHILNGYFPQGESRDHPVKFPAKKRYYENILRYLEENHTPKQRLCLVGDMNVAPEDSDIGIGADAHKRWLKTGKASFLPEEREWLATLFDWGLTDTYAAQGPEPKLMSWFDYRSRGFEREPKRGLRIDLILASKAAAAALTKAGIDHDIRAGEKPSDHCPIWAEFSV
ncbi:MAG: exodeoxyribonuclease III [Pseudomonadota bacterium]